MLSQKKNKNLVLMLINPFKANTLLRRAGSVLRRFTSKTMIVHQYAERFHAEDLLGNVHKLQPGCMYSTGQK